MIYLDTGFRGFLSYVGSNNFAALKSVSQLGYREVGRVYVLRFFRRHLAAYFALKRDAAPGVDGETWRHYGEAFEMHLADLSERLKRGAYRAKPVRRAYIAKADGRQRPLGIPTLEDKLAPMPAGEVTEEGSVPCRPCRLAGTATVPPRHIPLVLAPSRRLLSGSGLGNTGIEAPTSVSVTLLLRLIGRLTSSTSPP
jgi:hypothetical protein